MSATEIVKELEAVPESERTNLARRVLEKLYPSSTKMVDRMLRRLENPDIPEDVWRGIEEVEDGQLIDLDESLTELDRP